MTACRTHQAGIPGLLPGNDCFRDGVKMNELSIFAQAIMKHLPAGRDSNRQNSLFIHFQVSPVQTTTYAFIHRMKR